MLSFGNKEFRNLQEQVLKNMKDIQDIEQGATVLADFGIKVVGQVDSTDDLPDPTTYEGEYGDAYLVGTEKPYNYYIFTRAFEGQEEPSWFDLGEFPVPGPQGETGAQGPIGATPVIGATVGSVSTLNPGQSATASVSVSGTAAQPTMTFNFAIPQGAQGIQGATGPQGPQGPRGLQGEKGEKGEQGGLIDIVGIVATADLLPAPSTLQKLDAAYLVGASPDYELYVQVGETPSTALWTNLGAVNEGTVVTVNGTPQTVWEANTKVSVSDGYLMNTLYGQAAGTGNGQTHVPYGTAATANYIPQRDVNGQILVPETPTANNMAASKKYVDEHSSSSPIQYAGDLIVGDSQGEESRLAIGSAGQVLTVNSTGNGLEYTDIEGVPSFTNTDADKALKVNSAGTALEWGSAGGDSLINTVTYSGNNQPLTTVSLKDKAPKTISAGSTSGTSCSSGLIINDNLTETPPATYTVGSSGYFRHSILAYNGRYAQIPAMNQSIALINNDTYSSSTKRNLNQSIYLGNNTEYDLSTSILMGNGLATGSSSEGMKLERTIMLDGFGWKDKNKEFSNSLLLGSGTNVFDATDAVRKNLRYWKGIIFSSGSGKLNDTTNCNMITAGTNITSSKTIRGLTMLGWGNNISYNDNSKSLDGSTLVGIFGNLNIDEGDMFAVGCGTAKTAAANCITAGTNATDGDYLKIGDTKITEAQLQALLALLS